MVFLKSDSKYLIVIGIDHFSKGGVRESFVDSFVSCVLWEWYRLFNKCLFRFLIDGPVAVYLFWAVQRRLVQKQMLSERDALHSDCIHPFWWDFLRRCIIILRLNVQTMRLRSMFFFSSYTYYFQVSFPQNFDSNLVPQESVSKQLLRRINSKLFWGNWVHVTKIYWLTGIIHPPPPISPHHPSLWNKLGSTLHRSLLGSCPSMFCRWSYNWAIYRQIILSFSFLLVLFLPLIK